MKMLSSSFELLHSKDYPMMNAQVYLVQIVDHDIGTVHNIGLNHPLKLTQQHNGKFALRYVYPDGYTSLMFISKEFVSNMEKQHETKEVSQRNV